jgi:hypothetical protein
MMRIMNMFKDHKMSVRQLMGLIPDQYLEQLSLQSHVDRYAKVLHGRKLFYLLLYGIFIYTVFWTLSEKPVVSFLSVIKP